MQNILINDDFGKSIKRLRSILPVLSFSLLIITYLISAVIMGIFHAQNAPNWGFTVAAFLVPLAIQAGRGTLVFFFQLNPTHIQGRLSFGIIAATVLLILSLVEAYLVMTPYGLSWVISVCTLMIIGWVIEVMILKETIFATQIELFQDQERWHEVKGFYIAQMELQKFIEDLNNGKVLALPEPEQEEPATQQVLPKENKALSLLEEINQHLQGKDYRPSLNGKVKGRK
ncbi:MAG: hypothetical protein HRU41_24355 [Saprospiraceae bacterium]|nr:hypothetical protein [Saprospiraceae bacterium]